MLLTWAIPLAGLAGLLATASATATLAPSASPTRSPAAPPACDRALCQNGGSCVPLTFQPQIGNELSQEDLIDCSCPAPHAGHLCQFNLADFAYNPSSPQCNCYALTGVMTFGNVTAATWTLGNDFVVRDILEQALLHPAALITVGGARDATAAELRALPIPSATGVVLSVNVSNITDQAAADAFQTTLNVVSPFVYPGLKIARLLALPSFSTTFRGDGIGRDDGPAATKSDASDERFWTTEVVIAVVVAVLLLVCMLCACVIRLHRLTNDDYVIGDPKLGGVGLQTPVYHGTPHERPEPEHRPHPRVHWGDDDGMTHPSHDMTRPSHPSASELTAAELNRQSQLQFALDRSESIAAHTTGRMDRMTQHPRPPPATANWAYDPEWSPDPVAMVQPVYRDQPVQLTNRLSLHQQANAARLQGLTPQQFAQQLARQGQGIAPNHMQMQQPPRPPSMHAAHADHDRGGQQYAYAQGRSVHGPHGDGGGPLPPLTRPYGAAPAGYPMTHPVTQGYPTAGPGSVRMSHANPIDDRDGGYIANGGRQGSAYGGQPMTQPMTQPSAYGHQSHQGHQNQWGGALAGHPGGPMTHPMTHSPYGPTPEGYLTLN